MHTTRASTQCSVRDSKVCILNECGYIGLWQGGASARLSESKRVSPGLYSHPPLIGSVPIECACGEVVMCHAPHAGTFLEKG